MDLSSLSSSSSSLLLGATLCATLCATCCAEQDGEMIVLIDDTWDGVEDGDLVGNLDGLLALGGVLVLLAVVALIFDLRLAYLEEIFRCLDCVGRFQ
jgi:hypothetical protein